MRPDGHQRWEQLAVGHALHALEPDDEATFAAHLAECGRCAKVVAETEEVTAVIGSSVEPAEPRAGLWEAISERIDEEPGEPPRGAFPVTRAASRIPTAPEPALPMPATRRAHGVWVRPLMAAAAAVVVLVGVAVGGWQLTQHGARRSGVAALLDSCRTDAGCRMVALSGHSGGGVQARLLVRGDQATIVTSGLPTDDATRQTYVLWQLPADGRPVGLAAFHVGASGYQIVGTARLSLPYAGTTAFAVSLEKGAGIPPTPSTPIAVGAAAS
jgi:anti-sigma-K factor RskA